MEICQQPILINVDTQTNLHHKKFHCSLISNIYNIYTNICIYIYIYLNTNKVKQTQTYEKQFVSKFNIEQT